MSTKTIKEFAELLASKPEVAALFKPEAAKRFVHAGELARQVLVKLSTEVRVPLDKLENNISDLSQAIPADKLGKPLPFIGQHFLKKLAQSEAKLARARKKVGKVGSANKSAA